MSVEVHVCRGLGLTVHFWATLLVLLPPGSPYYARYDGGMDVAVDEANGVSSQLLGTAVGNDSILSSVRAGHVDATQLWYHCIAWTCVAVV